MQRVFVEILTVLQFGRVKREATGGDLFIEQRIAVNTQLASFSDHTTVCVAIGEADEPDGTKAWEWHIKPGTGEQDDEGYVVVRLRERGVTIVTHYCNAPNGYERKLGEMVIGTFCAGDCTFLAGVVDARNRGIRTKAIQRNQQKSAKREGKVVAGRTAGQRYTDEDTQLLLG